jgi:hypothetical protein
MVSAWRADTKDTLPGDTTNVFCSSVRVKRMPTYVLVDPVNDLLQGYLQKYTQKQNQNDILLYPYRCNSLSIINRYFSQLW